MLQSSGAFGFAGHKNAVICREARKGGGSMCRESGAQEGGEHVQGEYSLGREGGACAGRVEPRKGGKNEEPRKESPGRKEGGGSMCRESGAQEGGGGGGEALEEWSPGRGGMCRESGAQEGG